VAVQGGKFLNVELKCGVQIHGSPPNDMEAIFTHFCCFFLSRSQINPSEMIYSVVGSRSRSKIKGTRSGVSIK
jgi:hypothetical protein